MNNTRYHTDSDAKGRTQREREREKEREKERGRKREGEREREKERGRKREGERESEVSDELHTRRNDEGTVRVRPRPRCNRDIAGVHGRTITLLSSSLITSPLVPFFLLSSTLLSHLSHNYLIRQRNTVIEKPKI